VSRNVNRARPTWPADVAEGRKFLRLRCFGLATAADERLGQRLGFGQDARTLALMSTLALFLGAVENTLYALGADRRDKHAQIDPAN
jgi:hypothetical protein